MAESVDELVEQLTNLQPTSEGIVFNGVAIFAALKTNYISNDAFAGGSLARLEDYTRRIFQTADGSFRIGREDDGRYSLTSPVEGLDAPAKSNYFQQVFSIDKWRTDEGTLAATGRLNGAPFELEILRDKDVMYGLIKEALGTMRQNLDKVHARITESLARMDAQDNYTP